MCPFLFPELQFMKTKFSTIYIVISILLLLLKVIFEIYFFSLFRQQFEAINSLGGDTSTTVITGLTKIVIITLTIPFLSSVVFSVLGIINKNQHRFLALFLNILVLIILFVPISLLLFSYLYL